MNPFSRFTKWNRLVVALLLLSILLGACGPSPTPVAEVPTDTSVPPTNTSIPPTDTQIPPTDTPIPPTDTPTPIPPTDTPTPVPPTNTPTSVPPTDTPIPPTDTPVPPTDTPVPPTNTPVPQAAAPKPTAAPAKPKVGKIVFTSNRVSYDDLFIMNDDGTNIKQLTKKGKCYDAHFTPDGKTIFYDHENEQGDYDIWKMSAEGGSQVNLTNSPDKIEAFPVVAPDGSRVAYLFGWPGGFEIYTMKLDGTDPKPVTSRNIDWMPAWSPDSRKIAFSSLRSGSFNIWIVNRDGSDLKAVTKFGGDRWAYTPIFSPDGKQIAFSTIAEGTAWEIWVVNVDGSNPHKVQGAVGKDKNNSANIAAWKQGKFLIAGWEGNWEPYFVPEKGGAPVKIISGDKDDSPSDWWLP